MDTNASATTMEEGDRHPMLLARAWPIQELLAAQDFDRWQGEKHLADLMRGEGAVKVVYFKTIYKGLPQAYQGSGSIMAYYTARDVAGLYAWMNSKALRDGIEDGSRFFGKFNELDHAIYTGNVYRVLDVINNTGLEPPLDSPLYIERFEVDPARESEFDEWLHGVHLPAMAGDAGVGRVRTFAAMRDDVPIPYYLSPGNRMLAAELADRQTFREDLRSAALFAALEDSVRWDRQLNYVRREVYAYANHAHSEHGGAY